MRHVEEVIVVEKELAPEDVKKLSFAMAESYEKKKSAESNLKDYNKEEKERISGMNSFIGSCAEKIMLGKETKEIDCDIRYNWEENKKTWVDKETGEVMREIEIPEEDKQEDALENGTSEDGTTDGEPETPPEEPIPEGTEDGPVES